MAAYNKFQCFSENVCKAVHQLATDSLKLCLTNSAPVATNTLFSNITEIAAGNGYTAGGTAITITTSSQTSGTFTLAGNKVTFTASGGAVGPFRYVVFYDSTPTSPLKPLIAWWDYGSSISLNDGESLTVTFNSTDPGTIFTLV